MFALSSQNATADLECEMAKTKTAEDLPWKVEMASLRQLKPSPRNARTHSKAQVQQIANSMKRFGLTNPIIADDAGEIIAGHGRLEAAKLIGLNYFPVVRIKHLSESELRAYRLADNKVAQNAGWDREILAVELSELHIVLPELDLDLSITGFEPGEIDTLMNELSDPPTQAEDKISTTGGPVTTQLGDLFVLGNHRLIVGDARSEQTYADLMQSEFAEMAFHDPPYNVKIDGHVGGRGRIKHREFAEASGEMSSEEFTSFLASALSLCARYTADGGISYVCMDWRHVGELLKAGSTAFDELKNICVWTKTTPGQGSFYRSQHELVFVYKRGKVPHLNTFQLGQHGRTRSNVWSYPGANSFKAERMDELNMHPTVKPVAMIIDAMRDCSRRGAVVLDAFAGSGSTIMAAEQIGRRAYCIEIDPQYADVAVRRWQNATGKDAILGATGQSFGELSDIRLSSANLKPEKKSRSRKP